MRRALEERGPWDVVLSDWQMPRFSGTRALEMSREANSETPFVIVSEKVGEEQAVEALRAGAHDYVIKGNLTRLCATVERGLQEAEVRREREGERKALAAWVRAGAKRPHYEADAFPLPADWGEQPITARYRDGDHLKVRSILNDRCARCHVPEGDPKAQNFPLTTYNQVARYAKVDRGLMSEEKLIQSTHVHLLGFATLWGITGLIFALTSYPGWLRGLVAPLVLVVQVIDISCWWLARLEGPLGVQFALVIPVTGALVGTGLMVQIVLSLFNMYRPTGKAVVLALFLATAAGTYALGEKVIVPYLQEEREERKAAQEAAEVKAKEGQREGKGADDAEEGPASGRE
jgi:CheY-like chemotaxis protein